MKLFFVIIIFTLSGIAQAVDTTDTFTVSAVKPLSQIVNLHFGATFTNQPRFVRYDITNNGDRYLPFEYANIYGMYFDAVHTCLNGIQPFNRCSVEIRYWPTFEGYHHGELDLVFAGNNEIIFYLSGQAVR